VPTLKFNVSVPAALEGSQDAATYVLAFSGLVVAGAPDIRRRFLDPCRLLRANVLRIPATP